MRTLRPYQEDCVRDVRAALERKPSAVAVMPTGTGKTIVMAKIASGWERGNVLLLAHRVELLDQAKDKMAPELGYEPPVEQALRGADLDCLWQGGAVIIGSVQTLASDRRLEKFRTRPFDLILVDECHHATAASYRKVIDFFRGINPECKVLGVTATPRRADNTALGLVFEEAAFNYPIASAIDDGWLVPIRQEFVGIGCVDFSGVRLGPNDLGEQDLRPADLEELFKDKEPLDAIAAPVLEMAGDRQGLVFMPGVQSSHLLAAVLNDARHGCAAAVDGTTPQELRKNHVAAFQRGDLQFLVNFDVFTEGFDAPPAAVVAMARLTKSVGKYTQMMGRGLRPLDGVVDGLPNAAARKAAIAASGKPEMIALDFVGNSKHRLCSVADVLGGNFDAEVRDLANRRLKQGGGDVNKALVKAQAEVALLREIERLKGLRARVEYSTQRVDPFGDDAAPAEMQTERARGGATDGQVGFLVQLGVDRRTALRYGRKQASSVIGDISAKRCTEAQRKILLRHGECADIGVKAADAIIDELRANGWRPRRKGEAS